MATRDTLPEGGDMAAHAARLKEDAANLAGATGAELRRNMTAAAETLGDAARRMMDTTRSASREGLERVSHQVEERPIASIAIAAGIGFLLGMLIRR
ncbi:glycine zipper domain-containing protein [Pedomonas sp. V897]|uniref:glycine zipper domain-containing protein n=1 Tax=Pedomonas sp. V897 TaxID=3446482 RepID=UPI003EDF8348